MVGWLHRTAAGVHYLCHITIRLLTTIPVVQKGRVWYAVMRPDHPESRCSRLTQSEEVHGNVL